MWNLGSLAHCSSHHLFSILTNPWKSEELPKLPQARDKALCMLPIHVLSFTCWEMKDTTALKGREVSWVVCQPCCCRVAGQIGQVLGPDILRYFVYAAFETQHVFKVKSKWAFSLSQVHGSAPLASSCSHNHATPAQLPQAHISAASPSVLVYSVFENENILLSSKTSDLYLLFYKECLQAKYAIWSQLKNFLRTFRRFFHGAQQPSSFMYFASYVLNVSYKRLFLLPFHVLFSEDITTSFHQVYLISGSLLYSLH